MLRILFVILSFLFISQGLQGQTPLKAVCDSFSVTLNYSDTSELGSYVVRYSPEIKGYGNHSLSILYEFGDNTSVIDSVHTLVHLYKKPGSYTAQVSVTDKVNACKTSHSVTVIVEDKLLLPNFITPNGDGINDVFIVEGNGLDAIEFSVFSSFGNLVFQRVAPNILWEGKNSYGYDLKTGVYYYTLTSANGTKTNGTIHLYR